MFCILRAMRYTATVGLLLLIGCSTTREAPFVRATGCESLGVVEGATRHASGLAHTYALEPEWLRRPLSPEQADEYLWTTWLEAWNAEDREALRADTMFQQLELPGWQALQERREPGDRYWYYTTPDSYWNSLSGQEGVVLVRECAVVGAVVTWQS